MTTLTPIQLRPCAECGDLMQRHVFPSSVEPPSMYAKRIYCSRDCHRRAQTGRPLRTQATANALRRRARLAVPPGPCEQCGAAGRTDVHHRNGDVSDNHPTNLRRLCRTCHMREHNPSRQCSICSQPAVKGGLCNRHYIRKRRHGDPLAGGAERTRRSA